MLFDLERRPHDTYNHMRHDRAKGRYFNRSFELTPHGIGGRKCITKDSTKI